MEQEIAMLLNSQNSEACTREVLLSPENIMKLECEVKGIPSPIITWYKDGVTPLQRQLGTVRYTQFAIMLNDLVTTDSGNYTCKASNENGYIDFTYEVKINNMQQTGPTLIDESIMDVPIPCRVIGTINMLFCSFSVVSLLMYTLIILYNCRVCEHNDVSCRNMCEIDTKHKIGSSILLIFWMYMFLIIAFFIKIIVVNNGLRSFDLPTGGKKMELWVHYHKIFLIICLLSITFLGMKNMIGYNFYLFYYGISTIALIIELIIIGKFNKEYMISTDRYSSDVWYLNI